MKSPKFKALTVHGSTSIAVQAQKLSEIIPDVVLEAGQPGETAWKDFFDGKLANDNTRLAYNCAVRQFLSWCEGRGLALPAIRAGHVGEYLRAHPGSLPTKKQHVAAIRRFFNLLVERHIVLMNPAAVAETERYSVVEGKTPEIRKDDVRALLGAINTESVVGLRDRAAICTMIYTTARAGAVAKLRRGDLYEVGGQYVLHFDEKGGKSREIPVRHDLQILLLEYLEAAGLMDASAKTSFFQTVVRREKRFTGVSMSSNDMCRMVKRRMRAAGLPGNLTAHSFRVASITDLIDQGVPIEDVQYLAGHADARTTRLYHRGERKVTRNIVERISL